MTWLRLHRRIHILQAVNVRLRVKAEQLAKTNRVLTRELQQARRDCELLALGSKDREAALAFLRTSHDISSLEEPA